ncbi:2-hydroxyacyl-CoA dehydratase subunit D [candidate division CSSED10-310 bacterium]|uniref:2-hydroxyacyl-CoA dehydratase subunit D n=1 Tax=candidate division CSSED10-310 bacterium TaxID=2855610 RepID=A0ABV6Z1U9_UNCC1
MSLTSGIDNQLRDRLGISDPYDFTVWAKKGWLPIGYFCESVPVVMLSLGKLFPVRAHGLTVRATDRADAHLSQVACPYTRSVLETALQGDFDSFGGYIFATGCDHIRRLKDVMDYLFHPVLSHIIDVPHKRSEQALIWLETQIKQFGQILTSTLGVDTREQALSQAISHYNRLCELIDSGNALRKKQPPLLNGLDFQHLIRFVKSSPYEISLSILPEILQEAALQDQKMDHKSRLMVVGSVLDDAEYLKLIEAAGSVVVVDRYCSGSQPVFTKIDETMAPYPALARHVFERTACPRMMSDFNKRVAEILRLSQEFAVDGVMVSPLKSCDLWGVEAALLADILKSHNLPVLQVEREYRLLGESQFQTRVQAFLEIISFK